MIDNIKFIEMFFKLFGADVVIKCKDEEKISGEAIWKGEEETQEFLWYSIKIDESMINVYRLIEFIIENKLIKGDMIAESKDKLNEILYKSGWNRKIALDAVNNLQNIKISMIDNGKATDYFCIHF